MKTLSIFGFTGSIGTQALDIVRDNKESFELDVLVCNQDIKKAIEVVEEFNPKHIFFSNPEAKEKFKVKNNFDTELFDSLEQLTAYLEQNHSDLYLSAISSFECLELTMIAARSGKSLLLANKESLVVLGDVIINEAKRSSTDIIPIDSEHFSLFCSLRKMDKEDINKVFITASGGPFIGQSIEQVEDKSVTEALRHPNWDMGSKITIDSATLVNKCFELIEAKYLFDLNPDSLGVLIHPESKIHSLVELNDGSVEAQLSIPSMLIPLSYGLLGHHSKKTRNTFSLDMFDDNIGLNLNKFPKDRDQLIEIALDVMNNKQNRGLVFATINDFAVRRYLNEEISFGEIYNLIFTNYEKILKKEISNLDEIRTNRLEILDYLNN
jgi:1-deoxy-D-xylulose-5-phosphate reductoisomerase